MILDLGIMENTTVFDRQVMWYKKKMQAFSGKLKITNEGISFSQDKIRSGGGLLGALISSKSSAAKGGELFSESLSDVTFKKGRTMGKKSYILEVHLPDGRQFDFLFDDQFLSEVQDRVELSDE